MRTLKSDIGIQVRRIWNILEGALRDCVTNFNRRRHANYSMGWMEDDKEMDIVRKYGAGDAASGQQTNDWHFFALSSTASSALN